MDTNRVLREAKTKMAAAIGHFKDELKKLRTGRAHPSMLDSVTVEAYGQAMLLKSLAGITAPDAQLLVVSPFDPNNLEAIVTAIRDNESLGLNPADDGRVVRVAIPLLTTETRQDMVKGLNQKVEECAVSLRNARHEAHRQAEQAEREKTISRDERFKLEKQVDDLLNQHKNQIDELAKAKEQEVMTV